MMTDEEDALAFKLQWIPIPGMRFPSPPNRPKRLPSMVRLHRSMFEKIIWHGGKYVIRFNLLGDKDEIIQWIIDNIPNTQLKKDPTDLDLVRFKSKEDLMAFKLRWL